MDKLHCPECEYEFKESELPYQWGHFDCPECGARLYYEREIEDERDERYESVRSVNGTGETSQRWTPLHD